MAQHEFYCFGCAMQTGECFPHRNDVAPLGFDTDQMLHEIFMKRDPNLCACGCGVPYTINTALETTRRYVRHHKTRYSLFLTIGHIASAKRVESVWAERGTDPNSTDFIVHYGARHLSLGSTVTTSGRLESCPSMDDRTVRTFMLSDSDIKQVLLVALFVSPEDYKNELSLINKATKYSGGYCIVTGTLTAWERIRHRDKSKVVTTRLMLKNVQQSSEEGHKGFREMAFAQAAQIIEAHKAA